MADEIHERGLERARKIVQSWRLTTVSIEGVDSATLALAAAFQAAGDALHREADAATEAKKRGHQSLTKDLRNAAGRLVGIAQDLAELAKLDVIPADALKVGTTVKIESDNGRTRVTEIKHPDGTAEPYTPATDPVSAGSLHIGGDGSAAFREQVKAYLSGDTDDLPPDLSPAERALVEASDDAGAEGAAQADGSVKEDVTAYVRHVVEPMIAAAEEKLMTTLGFADPEPYRPTGVSYVPEGVNPDEWRFDFARLSQRPDLAQIPDHWSWSQLTTLEDCGVQYRLQRLEGVPQRPMWSNVGGRTFHTVTEQFDLGAWRAGGADLLPETHPELIGERWKAAFLAEIERTIEETGVKPGPEMDQWHAAQGGKEGYTWWLVEGERMLALYLHNRRTLDAAARKAGTVRKPLELIQYFQGGSPGMIDTERVPVIEYAYSRKVDGPTGSLTVEGVIDRAYECADGSLLVVDLKSGRSQPDSAQLGEYGQALFSLGVTHPENMHVQPIIRGVFYDARKGIFTEPVDLLDVHPAAEYAYRYHAAQAARQMGVYLPRKSNYCVSCSVRWACPVGGA